MFTSMIISYQCSSMYSFIFIFVSKNNSILNQSGSDVKGEEKENTKESYYQSVKWDFILTTLCSASLLMASNLLKKFLQIKVNLLNIFWYSGSISNRISNAKLANLYSFDC